MRAQGNLTKVQSLTESSSPGSPSSQSTQTSLSVQTFSDPLVPKQSEVFCHLLWAFLWPRPGGWKVLVEFPEMRKSSLLKRLSSGPHFPTQRKVLPVGQKPLFNACLLCATLSAQLQPTRAREAWEAKGLSHPVRETCPYQCPFSLLTPIRELKNWRELAFFSPFIPPSS